MEDKRMSFAEAADARPQSLVSDTLQFLGRNKKWWLLPIVAVLLLFGVFMLLGATAAAPFIYTLF